MAFWPIGMAVLLGGIGVLFAYSLDRSGYPDAELLVIFDGKSIRLSGWNCKYALGDIANAVLRGTKGQIVILENNSIRRVPRKTNPPTVLSNEEIAILGKHSGIQRYSTICIVRNHPALETVEDIYERRLTEARYLPHHSNGDSDSQRRDSASDPPIIIVP